MLWLQFLIPTERAIAESRRVPFRGRVLRFSLPLRHTKGAGATVLARWVVRPAGVCNFPLRMLRPSRCRDWKCKVSPNAVLGHKGSKSDFLRQNSDVGEWAGKMFYSKCCKLGVDCIIFWRYGAILCDIKNFWQRTVADCKISLSLHISANRDPTPGVIPWVPFYSSYP